MLKLIFMPGACSLISCPVGILARSGWLTSYGMTWRAMIEDCGRQSVLVGALEFMATVFEGIPGDETGLRRRGNDWQRYYADIKNPDPVDMSAAYEGLNIRSIGPPEDATF